MAAALTRRASGRSARRIGRNAVSAKICGTTASVNSDTHSTRNSSTAWSRFSAVSLDKPKRCRPESVVT